MMRNRAVIVGGFTTGKKVLEPVADAICERFGFGDADYFRFTDAVQDPARLERALRGQTAFAHSAGLLAVGKSANMRRVVAMNSPEPASIPTLAARAGIKTAMLWRTVATGPERSGALRVALSNSAELAAHPIVHARHVSEVSQFSTAERLSDMRTADIKTARIDTDGCEFFGPNALQEWDGSTVVLSGVHDQPLINPHDFFANVPQQIAE